MKECTHNLGFYEVEESHYGQTSYETHFVSIHDGIGALKSCTRFSFCPKCGANLEGLVDNQIQALQKEIDLEKERKLKEEEKRKELFRKRVIEFGGKTKLDTLSDGVNYIVLFNPTQRSYGKLIHIAGTKTYIIECAVRHSEGVYVAEELVINTVYQVPTPVEFEALVVKEGWVRQEVSDSSKFFIFTKEITTEKGIKLTKRIDYTESGSIYVDEFFIDEDGDKITNYKQFSIHRFSEYLGVEISLIKIEL